MENPNQFLQQRHSYRGQYTDKPVSREALKQIAAAAVAAPSGCNKQTTRFVIVDDPSLVGKIQTIHTANRAMQTAKAYVMCIVNKDPQAVYYGYSFEVEDCAAATQNMLLCISALGLASVWIDGWLRVDGHAETIGQLIGLPQDKVIRICLPIGYPAEPVTGPQKMPVEERVWFNAYGAK